mmetsp:Transcript_30671/g.98846  ORF Transcript_30671/g.98846 Transcript_30671/m.98846 type:complete len:345 (+) Transcript_30671:57-1091(+)
MGMGASSSFPAAASVLFFFPPSPAPPPRERSERSKASSSVVEDRRKSGSGAGFSVPFAPGRAKEGRSWRLEKSSLRTEAPSPCLTGRARATRAQTTHGSLSLPPPRADGQVARWWRASRAASTARESSGYSARSPTASFSCSSMTRRTCFAAKHPATGQAASEHTMACRSTQMVSARRLASPSMVAPDNTHHDWCRFFRTNARRLEPYCFQPLVLSPSPREPSGSPFRANHCLDTTLTPLAIKGRVLDFSTSTDARFRGFATNFARISRGKLTSAGRYVRKYWVFLGSSCHHLAPAGADSGHDFEQDSSSFLEGAEGDGGGRSRRRGGRGRRRRGRGAGPWRRS